MRPRARRGVVNSAPRQWARQWPRHCGRGWAHGNLGGPGRGAPAQRRNIRAACCGKRRDLRSGRPLHAAIARPHRAGVPRCGRRGRGACRGVGAVSRRRLCTRRDRRGAAAPTGCLLKRRTRARHRSHPLRRAHCCDAGALAGRLLLRPCSLPAARAPVRHRARRGLITCGARNSGKRGGKGGGGASGGGGKWGGRRREGRPQGAVVHDEKNGRRCRWCVSAAVGAQLRGGVPGDSCVSAARVGWRGAGMPRHPSGPRAELSRRCVVAAVKAPNWGGIRGAVGVGAARVGRRNAWVQRLRPHVPHHC